MILFLESEFQPTRPLRGATWRRSTAAPTFTFHFNPRAPCGARLNNTPGVVDYTLFQPTRPLRGATEASCLIASLITDFNPRAPCGARLDSTPDPLGIPIGFQPTRPLRGATQT